MVKDVVRQEYVGRFIHLWGPPEGKVPAKLLSVKKRFFSGDISMDVEIADGANEGVVATYRWWGKTETLIYDTAEEAIEAAKPKTRGVP